MPVQGQRDLLTTYVAAQSALRTGTMLDLIHLWPLLDFKRLDRTYPAWERAVTTLVQRDRGRFEALAADYVREAARIAGVQESPSIVNQQLEIDRLATSLRITSIVATRNALGAGMDLDGASASAAVQSAGAAARYALDGGRETVARSTVASGGRWGRVASAGACGFCRILASRGAIYTDASVRFASHDHCGCAVASTFGDAAEVLKTFTPTAKDITDTDRARTRAWIRDHPDAA